MNLKYIAIFVLSCSLVTSIAQVTSVNGRFQVDVNTGCVPLTVNVTLISPFTCPCAVDYLGQGNASLDPTIPIPGPITYDQPGTYNLRILFGASLIDQVQIIVKPNPTPSFDVFACSGNQVSYTVTDINYPEYIIDFNDGNTTSTTSGIHAYTPGPHSISVRGFWGINAADNCPQVDQSFTTLNTINTPAINRLTVLDQSSIQLDMTTQNQVDYSLEMSVIDAATFQFQQGVLNNNTATVNNLDTDNGSYCFQLKASDLCNNTTFFSNTICSAVLNLNVQSDVNQLSWQTITTPPAYFGTVNQYRIRRDNTPYLIVPKNLNNQDDINVNCGINYCYQHIIEYADGSESYSRIRCGTAFSTTPPTPIIDISTRLNNNDVDLEWLQDPGYSTLEYAVYRSVNGGDFKVIAKTPATTALDNDYATGDNMCYRIIYRDQCGNQSAPGALACPIQLTSVLQEDNAVMVTWSPYEGWFVGVANYTIEKYDYQGALLETVDVGTSTSYLDINSALDNINQVYYYVVTANPTDPANSVSVSNKVEVIKDSTPSYPKAFTPNNDGLNDIFTVFGPYIADFNMKIFNRWGELIYITSDLSEGWNGTFNEKNMPEGTYVFKADITDFAGRSIILSGPIMLIRKR